MSGAKQRNKTHQKICCPEELRVHLYAQAYYYCAPHRPILLLRITQRCSKTQTQNCFPPSSPSLQKAITAIRLRAPDTCVLHTRTHCSPYAQSLLDIAYISPFSTNQTITAQIPSPLPKIFSGQGSIVTRGSRYQVHRVHCHSAPRRPCVGCHARCCVCCCSRSAVPAERHLLHGPARGFAAFHGVCAE